MKPLTGELRQERERMLSLAEHAARTDMDGPKLWPGRFILLRKTGNPGTHRIYASDSYIAATATIPATATGDRLLEGNDNGKEPDEGDQSKNMAGAGVLLDAASIIHAAGTLRGPLCGHKWRRRDRHYYPLEWVFTTARAALTGKYQARIETRPARIRRELQMLIRDNPATSTCLLETRQGQPTVTLLGGDADTPPGELQLNGRPVMLKDTGPARVALNPARLDRALALHETAGMVTLYIPDLSDGRPPLPVYVTDRHGRETVIAPKTPIEPSGHAKHRRPS